MVSTTTSGGGVGLTTGSGTGVGVGGEVGGEVGSEVVFAVDGMKWLVSQTRSSEWTPQLTNAL